jgi:hypothetical protein
LAPASSPRGNNRGELAFTDPGLAVASIADFGRYRVVVCHPDGRRVPLAPFTYVVCWEPAPVE